MMYSGYIFGILSILYLYVFQHLDINVLHLALYFQYLPTVFTSYFVKNRIIKDIARLLLGISIINAFTIIILGVFQGVYWISVIVAIQYYFFKNKLSTKRETSNHKVCQNCDEYNNPRCEGFKDFFDRKQIYESGLIRLDAFAE